MAANDAALEALLASAREQFQSLVDIDVRARRAGGRSARRHLLAARAVRNALMDHARRKRGAVPEEGLPLELIAVAFEERAGDLLDLDDALDDLAGMNAGVAEIVELRFFGGFTCREAAALLGLSCEKVEMQWDFARAWLRESLG